MRRTLALAAVGLFLSPAPAADWPFLSAVEAQPLLAQARRVAQALDQLGHPAAEAQGFGRLNAAEGDAAISAAVQKALDPHCLAAVVIGPGGVERAFPAPRRPALVEQGWRPYLVKVVNPAGATGRLKVTSPNALPVPHADAPSVPARWLGLDPYTAQPLLPNLSGLGLEYVVVQVYRRDAGEKAADLAFQLYGGAGPKTREPAISPVSVRMSFDARPSLTVAFRVTEADGTPTTAAFLIRDAQGRVYPAQSKRLAPDFFFQPQVYRATGETVRLPAGRYTVVCSRGPESVPETKELVVGNQPATLAYEVKRWTDPARRGWHSGDHHIHAAGCAHYEKPTEGVEPADMMRHVLGEDLKVGCCLTWGPCFDYQKRFFTGKPDQVSRPPHLLRYDVEVSGFGSHQSGHLNLLNLSEQMPAGGKSKDHWPTLGLNTLRWAKKQGAVCGPAHSANGLTRVVGRVDGATDGPNGLPTFNIPAYDGIGANEFVVDVAHTVPGPDGRPVPAVDFISTMDTDRKAELTMWYHALNCGFRVRASGETDFPCISGDRVGAGRSYVHCDGPLTFEKWVAGIAAGRSYVSDGSVHLMDYAVSTSTGRLEVGREGSELPLAAPGRVTATVRAAARVPGQKTVPVELVVNGLPAGVHQLPADGSEHELTFTAHLPRSAWVAVRVFPHAHTNPVFVTVAGQPIRASKRSAEWMLRGVDQCWTMKQRTYAPAEQAQAAADYEAARQVYRRIRDESPE